MLSKQEQQQLDEATAALAAALRQAVQDTVTAGGPKPAREAIDGLLETHHHQQACPDQLMVGYQLVGWLGTVRDALGDRPQRVDEVLGWVEEAVGRRYRARARYTSGALDSEGMESQTMHYADALGVDFLPSLIWLLAGAVARYGDGDVEWLRRLEQAPAT